MNFHMKLYLPSTKDKIPTKPKKIMNSKRYNNIKESTKAIKKNTIPVNTQSKDLKF